jgi:hypothetical protein
MKTFGWTAWGFIVSIVYGFSRPTGDLDVLEIALPSAIANVGWAVVRPCVCLDDAVKQRSSQSISANQSGSSEPAPRSTKGSTHRFDHRDESLVHDQY